MTQTLQAAPARLQGIRIHTDAPSTGGASGDAIALLVLQAPAIATLKELHLAEPISLAVAEQLLSQLPALTSLTATVCISQSNGPAIAAFAASAASAASAQGSDLPPAGAKCVLASLDMTVESSASFSSVPLAHVFAQLQKLDLLDMERYQGSGQELWELFRDCQELQELKLMESLEDRLLDGQYVANKLACLPQMQVLVLPSAFGDLAALLAAPKLKKAFLHRLEFTVAELREAAAAGRAAQQLELLVLKDVWVRDNQQPLWWRSWIPERGCLAKLLPALEELIFHQTQFSSIQLPRIGLWQLAMALAGHSRLTFLQAYPLYSEAAEWFQPDSLLAALAECPALHSIGVLPPKQLEPGWSTAAWRSRVSSAVAEPMADGRLRNLMFHRTDDYQRPESSTSFSLADVVLLLRPPVGAAAGAERELLSMPVDVTLDVADLDALVQQLAQLKAQQAEEEAPMQGSSAGCSGPRLGCEQGSSLAEHIMRKQQDLRDHIGDMLGATAILEGLLEQLWRRKRSFRGALGIVMQFLRVRQQLKRRAAAMMQQVAAQCGGDAMRPLPADWQQQLEAMLQLRLMVDLQLEPVAGLWKWRSDHTLGGIGGCKALSLGVYRHGYWTLEG